MIEQHVTGFYRHYKGGVYRIIATGKHTETEEEMVVYQPWTPLSNERWIRPLKMWDDFMDETKTKRFCPLSFWRLCRDGALND